MLEPASSRGHPGGLCFREIPVRTTCRDRHTPGRETGMAQRCGRRAPRNPSHVAGWQGGGHEHMGHCQRLTHSVTVEPLLGHCVFLTALFVSFKLETAQTSISSGQIASRWGRLMTVAQQRPRTPACGRVGPRRPRAGPDTEQTLWRLFHVWSAPLRGRTAASLAGASWAEGRWALGAGRWAGCVSVSATWRVCLGDSSSRGLRALPYASSVVNRVPSPAEGHLKGPVGGPGPLPLIARDRWPSPALSPKALGVGEPRRSGPSGGLPARWGLGRMSKCPARSRQCCGRLAHACPPLVSGL